MKHSQGTVLATVRSMVGFLSANTAVLGPGVAVARKNLDETGSSLTALAAQQNVGARNSKGGTNAQRVLRDELRITHMRPIARAAKLKLRQIPDYPKLRMPHAHVSSAQLIADAEGMAVTAQPHRQVFVEAGLEPDFIAELRAAAAAFQQSATDAAVSNGKRSGATKGLRAEESEARGQMSLLDALVRPKIAGNATLLGEWDRVRKIPKKVGPVATAVTPVPNPHGATHTIATSIVSITAAA